MCLVQEYQLAQTPSKQLHKCGVRQAIDSIVHVFVPCCTRELSKHAWSSLIPQPACTLDSLPFCETRSTSGFRQRFTGQDTSPGAKTAEKVGEEVNWPFFHGNIPTYPSFPTSRRSSLAANKALRASMSGYHACCWDLPFQLNLTTPAQIECKMGRRVKHRICSINDLKLSPFATPTKLHIAYAEALRHSSAVLCMEHSLVRGRAVTNECLIVWNPSLAGSVMFHACLIECLLSTCWQCRVLASKINTAHRVWSRPFPIAVFRALA